MATAPAGSPERPVTTPAGLAGSPEQPAAPKSKASRTTRGAGEQAAAPKSKASRTTSSAGEQAAAPDDDAAAPGAAHERESGPCFIVAKTVRCHLKECGETGMMCASDLIPALNTKITDMINEAARRAQKNSRKTIKACDL